MESELRPLSEPSLNPAHLNAFKSAIARHLKAVRAEANLIRDREGKIRGKFLRDAETNRITKVLVEDPKGEVFRRGLLTDGIGRYGKYTALCYNFHKTPAEKRFITVTMDLLASPHVTKIVLVGQNHSPGYSVTGVKLELGAERSKFTVFRELPKKGERVVQPTRGLWTVTFAELDCQCGFVRLTAWGGGLLNLTELEVWDGARNLARAPGVTYTVSTGPYYRKFDRDEVRYVVGQVQGDEVRGRNGVVLGKVKRDSQGNIIEIAVQDWTGRIDPPAVAAGQEPFREPSFFTSDGLDNHGGGAMRADFRTAHFPFAIVPLTYGKDTKKACIAFLGHAFLREMDNLRRKHGLFYMANAQHAFTRSAIYADVQFCDVFMVEWGGSASEPVSRKVSRYMRTLCGKKLVCYWPIFRTLRPWVEKDAEGQMRAIDQHFQRGLFWGIFPGAVQSEKTRSLYKKYIPILEKLYAAGWERVTLARENRPEVGIERFGYPARGETCFTLRNFSKFDTDVRVSFAAELMRGIPKGAVPIARDLTNGERFNLNMPAQGEPFVTLRVGAFQTRVLRLEFNQ